MRGVTRREFLGAAALGAMGAKAVSAAQPDLSEEFLVQPDELTLRLRREPGGRRLSYHQLSSSYDQWSETCRAKLVELIGYTKPRRCGAELLRTCRIDGVTIEAWVMRVDESLTLPAYLLGPRGDPATRHAVMAIHGHGEVQALLGLYDDYHHVFGLELAKAGHLVLCPALRGFGPLYDMALTDTGRTLDYWGSNRGHQFTLVTDAFLFGQTVIGETVADLIRWEDWLARERGIRSVDSVGISYGGDLSITYPAFSRRVRRIYCSGSMGSFSGIFARCYNAPAHCIPHVLQWMDRSDIAGLSAPRPIRLHYGELDTPGPENASAAYNETVEPALAELRAIYAAAGAPHDAVSMHVTPGAGHEMDIADLVGFLA